ncbi:uncharacterized protein LOC126199038 isoform X1 [Schistocerca nitens]|uniref:uncharacterized protein LOC126199038 isoform X1 n=1 Tax=Schistocerca nitens TaxID=7011 RepID=UPI002117474A|nr:uncharacterized protein LOC126199038 isoform X1 [Schistocerca nitens]XP_049791697.1 uncharacterized protein LOC126199038 isoform X1 [Schistocerca nitens]
MHPAVALLGLLLANDTALLDCVCSRINDAFELSGLEPLSRGEQVMHRRFCSDGWSFTVAEDCRGLEPPPVWLAAVGRLLPRDWLCGPPPPAGGGGCGGALEGLRRLTVDEPFELATALSCRIAADCVHACPVHGLEDIEWNVGTLKTDDLRNSIQSQLLHAVRRITRAGHARHTCYMGLKFPVQRFNKTEYLKQYSDYWRDSVELVSLRVRHLSKLFVPLAFEQMVNHTTDQQLHRWMKDMERVKDMLVTKLMGLVQDVHYVREHITNYEIEEDKNKRGKYTLRRPLLSDRLLYYEEQFLTFREDFSDLCEGQQPEASQMFAFADTLYSLYRHDWLRPVKFRSYIDVIDEKWQLDVKGDATVSVDTDCIQLLVDTLDHPTCPLEDLPPESIAQRQQCRAQLWDDMVQRSPHVPVTSYLAYTQRTNINLCLLAWMAANSLGVCQDVPFSVIQSAHDARCYFDSPDDRSCMKSNATDSICSVSRAILLLKCEDFSFNKRHNVCTVDVHRNGSFSRTTSPSWGRDVKAYVEPTERTLNYKYSLSSATLKYKDFKLDSLKPLEISFITVNILFRFLTAGLFMYLSHFRNLPGKILLSYQITGIIQVLCSEVLYRMAGVPDLSTMVLIDSALTLLSCIWLNTFCYQMYACIRHLRLPNVLPPAEARKVFRRQVLYALIPWSAVCTASTVLENTSKYYLFHSRIIFLGGISLSIAFNLVCLGIVAYMYRRAKNSMSKLKIYSKDKIRSKTEVLYLTFKTFILSGTGVLIRIGFHQAEGIAQYVYYVHIATMMQGPLMFVLFICNKTSVPALRKRLQAWGSPDAISPGQELCSTAERNLRKRTTVQSPAAESSL